MDNKFIIILIVTIFMIGNAIFTQDSLMSPGILRSNIIIFGLLGLLFLFAYGYVPITKTGKKAKVYFFIAVFAIFLCSFIYSIIPPVLSTTEKSFIEHLDSGYSFYQSREYENALDEYKIAESIYKEDSKLYIYKAYCYEKQKEYTKAIENAREALKYPDSKSIYKKAHNLKLINSNNDISAYTIIGECSYKLKQYEQARDAFSYVIEHVTYKYTDAYLWRGKCEYHLKEKQAALRDFQKHSDIIDLYIDEQANSDYPSEYPTYTHKDLIRTNKWISDTNNL